MIIRRLIILISLALFTGAACAVATPEADSTEDVIDELLLDATWVPCGDTTESLYLFADGRAVYARGRDGVVFSLGPASVRKVRDIIDSLGSVIDTAALDSCTTIGVILEGPRYLLINGAAPTEQTLALRDQLVDLRRTSIMRLDQLTRRMLERIDETEHDAVKTDPSLMPEVLQSYIYDSPIASTWNCRGRVTVTALVDSRGKVRRAFARDADVKGKCASLLITTALRAVMLASFNPAIKEDGVGSAWMNVVVSFGRDGATSRGELVR